MELNQSNGACVKFQDSFHPCVWNWLIEHIPHSVWRVHASTRTFYFLNKDDAVWFQLVNGGQLIEEGND